MILAITNLRGHSIGDIAIPGVDYADVNYDIYNDPISGNTIELTGEDTDAEQQQYAKQQ